MPTVTTTEPVAGRRMTNRELVMSRLVEDFDTPENFAIIESLVEGTSGVSLRLLDFFLCHYSLKHNVQYDLPQEALPFNVHDEYSQYLSQTVCCKRKFGKVLFDCFSRKERAVLKRGDKTIHTSAGQAHMVAWAIEKRVMPYVVENAAAIRQDLKAHSKKARLGGGRRKNKANIQKKDPIDHSFALPASWHCGRKFKMRFSLKESS